MTRVMPRLSQYRNKVAAHFALADPRRDNKAGLAASPYIGTSSLGMALIQVPKLIIFGAGDLLTIRVLLLGLGLGAVAAVTAYLGRWILRRVPEKVFPRIITTMLLVSGIILLIRG